MKDCDHSVSVIIPVFNGGRYLGEAIESVLGQTYGRTELIVIDDGSTDDSAKVAKRYEPAIRYLYQPNSGISAALNRGVEAAQGSFLAFLDADDIWTEDKLARQMAVFDNHSHLDIVFGQVKQFFSPELNEDQRRGIAIPAEPSRGIFKGSMLIRRASFIRVGVFDSRWKVGDFISWYLKAMDEGLRSVVLDDIVVLRRVHTNNMGIRLRDSRTDYVRILKAALDRRRRMQNAEGDI